MKRTKNNFLLIIPFLIPPIPFPLLHSASHIPDMPKAKKVPMRSFTAFVLDKHKYSVKDTILAYSGTKSPFIGEIVKIEGNPDDSQNTMVTLKWFYRPEEIHGGRRDYQGKDELLRSDHTDQIRVNSVSGPCKIVSFEAIGSSPRTLRRRRSSFTREFYDHKAEDIVSTTPLEKICVCQTPQSPNLQMIECDACESWYHVKCVQVSQEDAEKKSFICPECQRTGIKLL